MATKNDAEFSQAEFDEHSKVFDKLIAVQNELVNLNFNRGYKHGLAKARELSGQAALETKLAASEKEIERLKEEVMFLRSFNEKVKR